MASEAFEKIRPEHILFVLPLLITLLVIYLQRKKDEKTYFKFNVFLSLVLILAIIFTNKIIDNNLSSTNHEDGWKSDLYLYNSFHSKNRFFERFGVIEYIVCDIKEFISSTSSSTLTEDERAAIDELVQSKKIVENDMTGIFEGKNLILILAESLNNYPINAEVMPTLNAMKENALYFSNFHAPIWQSATGDSEFISLTSMLPSVDYGTTSYTFYNNNYPYSLPNMFNDIGYNSNSYHSYISNFYNRELFHESLGFTTFYDIDKLMLKKPYGFEEGTNWINDEYLFLESMNKTNIDEPFFDFIIAVSGHMPYRHTRQELKNNYEEINKTSFSDMKEEIKYYLAAQRTFDDGLKVLMDYLENENLLEDTVIAIYGDHYPYGIRSESSLKICTDEESYNINRVPFIIYNPSLEGQTIDKIASTFDIYPTLCNMFGFDYSDALVVGQDIFSEEDGYVISMDRSILTEDFYYNSNTNTIDILSDEYSESDQLKLSMYVKEVFDLCQTALVGNYYEE